MTSKYYTYHSMRTIVESVLLDMDWVRRGIHSDSAVELICMIAAHESHGGKYRDQIAGGPGSGLLQFEPPSYHDVWKHSDTIRQTAEALEMHESFCQVRNDDVHSIYVARHKIAMDSEALPAADDAFGLAKYAKRVWNGNGKATPDKYRLDYMRWKDGRL